MDNNSDIAKFLTGVNRIFAFLIYKKVKAPFSIKLLEIVRDFISSTLLSNDINFNQFKNEIFHLNELDLDSKEYLKDALELETKIITTDNFDEIKKYLPLINDSIVEICLLIDLGKMEQAYALADAVHCLPVALLKRKKWNSKAYWKTYITPYRLKWNKLFLQQQESEIRKSSFWKKLF